MASFYLHKVSTSVALAVVNRNKNVFPFYNINLWTWKPVRFTVFWLENLTTCLFSFELYSIAQKAFVCTVFHLPGWATSTMFLYALVETSVRFANIGWTVARTWELIHNRVLVSFWNRIFGRYKSASINSLPVGDELDRFIYESCLWVLYLPKILFQNLTRTLLCISSHVLAVVHPILAKRQFCSSFWKRTDVSTRA